MRVLWFVRDNLETHPGGDTTQILRTAAALRRLGVSIDFTSDPAAPLDGCDVVHLFHLDRLWEHLPVCRRLRAANAPAVLSTIYWPSDEFDRAGRGGVQGALARLLGTQAYQALRQVQRGGMQCLRKRSLSGWDRGVFRFRGAARRLLETVSVILPNSEAEREQVERNFGVRRLAVVVPNAVEADEFGSSPPADAARAGVLCVGRIEPRKNQHVLLEALRDADIPVTLVGHAGRFSGSYFRRCRRAAGPNARFLEHQTAAQLGDLYRSARVHACVSWYETPGLASLEAALCGCRLVVTPGGSTREYFGDQAHYCRPDQPESIRAAVEAALAAPPDADLSQRVAREYTWDAAARATLRGYELATSGRNDIPRRA